MIHHLRSKLATLGVLAAFCIVFVLSGVGITSAQARSQTGSATLPLRGSGTALLGSSTTPTPVNFEGTMTVQRFASTGHDVWAVGTISGTVTDATGAVLGTVNDVAKTLQVQRADPTCPILNLNLGPLHLDLLGLVVDLNQVVLTITAVSGAGNLLGNLLCAVAHLLDGSAAGNAIANLLNQILSILSGLGV